MRLDTYIHFPYYLCLQSDCYSCSDLELTLNLDTTMTSFTTTFITTFDTTFNTTFKTKRASPGIEPGPPAPKAGILPLNYKALIHMRRPFFCSLCAFCASVCTLYFSIPSFLFKKCYFVLKKGLRRESNPGHPHPKRVFYHLTTKP